MRSNSCKFSSKQKIDTINMTQQTRFKQNFKDDGIYDTRDGFYFRQRKGMLSIRKLELVDLEKLIREVDIDILQQNMEDLTFSDFNEQHLQFFTDLQIVKLFKLSQLIIEYLLYTQNKLVDHLSDLSHKYTAKKRSLHQKRKEIAILKEESRNLQDEVKLKRRGLRSLHKAVERASQETISSVAKHDNPKTEDAMQQHVCLFIAFPDGSCMELLALPHWTIKMIDEFVRKKFPSKIIRSSNGSEHNYYHRGTLLPNDLTVRDCGISNQDTINMVTVIDLVNESTTIGVGKISENEPDDKIVGVVNQQMQVLQQLALDIRNLYQQSACPKPATEVHNSSALALEAIQTRLMNIEHELQEIPNRNHTVLEKHVIFGELENDKDDGNLNGALDEIKQKIGESWNRVDNLGSKVDELRSLRDIVNDQRNQIEELKKVVQNPIVTTVVQQVPLPISTQHQPVKVQPVVKSKQNITVSPKTMDPATNKWNTIMTDSEVKQKKIDVEVFHVAPKPQTVPDNNSNSNMEPIEHAANENTANIPVSHEESPRSTVIAEGQSAAILEQLSKIEKNEVSLNIEDERSLLPLGGEPDKKIIVEFPTQYNDSLRQVGFISSSLSVDLDPDMRDDEVIIALRKAFSAHTKIPYSHTALKLDNFQVKLAMDLQGLIPHLTAEEASYLASIGRLQIFFNQPTITKLQIDTLGSFRQVDSPRSPREPRVIGALDELRLSLNNILESVSGVGLSDDDMTQKRKHMEEMMSVHDKLNFRKSRLSLVKNVGYVTSESDSDFLIKENAYNKDSDWENVENIHRRRSYNSLWQDFSNSGTSQLFPTTSFVSDIERRFQMDRTIDSEGNNMPIHHRPSEHSIMRYADTYERDTNRSEDSPFDGAKMDSLDHSLALSDSNNFADTF